MTCITINADVLDVDPSVLACADCLITDPPYSPWVHEQTVSVHTPASGGPAARDLGFAPLTPELRMFLASLAARVRWSCIFSDVEGTGAWIDDLGAAGAEYIRSMPWVRWSQPQITGDRPGTGHEHVIIAHGMTPPGPRGGGAKPTAKHWNGAGGFTCIDSRSMRGASKHPSQKPLDACLHLVSAFSDPGECVLDPCAGWGTIALACHLLGRDCVQIERDGEHARVAEARGGGMLDARDRERCERWIADVAAWDVDEDASPNAVRRASARAADLECVASRI